MRQKRQSDSKEVAVTLQELRMTSGWQAAKQLRPQSYNHVELNSANNLNDYLPKPPDENLGGLKPWGYTMGPGEQLMDPLDPWTTEQPGHKSVWFKLLNLWEFIMAATQH